MLSLYLVGAYLGDAHLAVSGRAVVDGPDPGGPIPPTGLYQVNPSMLIWFVMIFSWAHIRHNISDALTYLISARMEIHVETSPPIKLNGSAPIPNAASQVPLDTKYSTVPFP